MKNARPANYETSADVTIGIVPSIANFSKFAGTTNPRHLRVIQGLRTRSMRREIVDRIAGCSNGPDLIAQLRRLGLDIPCTRVPAIDRDGREVMVGVYYLTDSDRRKVERWLRERKM